jgi:hypothetical protein
MCEMREERNSGGLQARVSAFPPFLSLYERLECVLTRSPFAEWSRSRARSSAAQQTKMSFVASSQWTTFKPRTKRFESSSSALARSRRLRNFKMSSNLLLPPPQQFFPFLLRPLLLLPRLNLSLRQLLDGNPRKMSMGYLRRI